MGKWDTPAKHIITDTELRFNPYHDPQNGRFTTAGGGGGGGFLYSKGGKSAYVFEKNSGQDFDDAEYEKWASAKAAKSKSGAVYKSDDEVLYVEKLLTHGYSTGEDVLEATADDDGNLTLDYANAKSKFQQNSKTNYNIYEVKTGITNARDVHGARNYSTDAGESKVKKENSINGTRSVGINWDKVKSVSGQTYNVKGFIKEKGFKWDKETKKWVK